MTQQRTDIALAHRRHVKDTMYPVLARDTIVQVGRWPLMKVIDDPGPAKERDRTVTMKRVDGRNDDIHRAKRFNVALPRPRE